MNLAYHDAKSSAPHEVGNHREASIAAEQISQPKATAAPQNTHQNAPASIASTARSPRCELSYLHCCTAASVSLLILSVASFVVPSVSTYPAERSTVQGLGYTAGVISLLTSIATGAFVAYVYPINDCFRN
jgi:hypothetical protein